MQAALSWIADTFHELHKYRYTEPNVRKENTWTHREQAPDGYTGWAKLPGDRCKGNKPVAPESLEQVWNNLWTWTERCGGWSEPMLGSTPIFSDYERWDSILPLILLFSTLWMSMRVIIKEHVLLGLAKRYVKKSHSTKTLYKFTYQGWLLLYYTNIAIFGFLATHDEPWFEFPLDPMTSGLATVEYPPEHNLTTPIKFYYVCQIGFYAAELFAIFVEPKRADFLEYFVHHVVTLILMVGSLSAGYSRGGSMIVILHDTSDGILSLAKMLNYTKLPQIIADVIFGVFIVSWFWLRVWCSPWFTYTLLTITPQVTAPNTSWLILYVCLYILHMLQFLWTMLILRTVYRIVVKRDSEDERSDDDDDDDEGGLPPVTKAEAATTTAAPNNKTKKNQKKKQ